jgi:hypothetical protein
MNQLTNNTLLQSAFNLECQPCTNNDGIAIGTLIAGSLLLISEAIPFINNVRANGIVHAVVILIQHLAVRPISGTQNAQV